MLKDLRSGYKKYFKDTVQDHPLYLVCPDLLCAVGDTFYGTRVGFIGSTRSLHYLFMYLFICI